MNAKIATRIDLNRRDLAKLLPLDTPLSLSIDPASICNFKCGFCACGRANRQNWAPHRKVGVLEWELFCGIIDGMRFPQQIKALHLYKEGEPLLNPRLADMVAYAKLGGVAERVDFTTNAALLMPDKGRELVAAGLDRVNISIEGLDDEGYKRNSGVNFSFETIVENVRSLYECREQLRIFVKIPQEFLGTHTTNEFYDTFGDMCDEIAVEHLSNCWPEFEYDTGDAQASNVNGLDVTPNEICPLLFYHMTVNSDGTASACYVDWNRKLIIGDAKTETLTDIWTGTALATLRRAHLNLCRDTFSPCANCGELRLNQIDSVDADRLHLLKIYA
jgi:MoaA/NifB/PqqE/SkfB family radical SAM enzyme